uniref:Replication initiator protein n=2 Tax=Dulem virus 165 TaxID=3145642 RepID=A0AAU8AZL4_9VIRU
MPCFKPIKAWYIPQRHAASKIFFNVNKDFPMQHPNARVINLPCGQCIGCRINRSRVWAMRCVYEYKLNPVACFITLTYDDNHLPSNDSLVVADLQKFFKRLRKSIPERIRYLACGEYGDQSERPHYHAILFGLDLTKTLSRKIIEQDGRQRVVFESPLLKKVWKLGSHHVGKFSFDSAAYVASYALKRVYGEKAEEWYHGRHPEFLCVSSRPGIGAGYYEKYKDDIIAQDSVMVSSKNGYIRCKPPKYYDKLHDKEDHLGFCDTRDARVNRRAQLISEDDLARIEKVFESRQKAKQI